MTNSSEFGSIYKEVKTLVLNPFGELAQLVVALALQARCQEFESPILHGTLVPFNPLDQASEWAELLIRDR